MKNFILVEVEVFQAPYSQLSIRVIKSTMPLSSAAILLNGTLAIDPSSLIFGDIELAPKQPNIELVTQYNQVQLDKETDFRFIMTGIRTGTVIDAPKGQVALYFNTKKQHYFIDNGTQQISLSLPAPTVYAAYRVNNSYIGVSPQELHLESYVTLREAQLDMACSLREYPISFSAGWYDTDVELAIGSEMVHRFCSASVRHGSWSTSFKTQLIDHRLRYGAATLGYSRDGFGITATHQAIVQSVSDHWQIDTRATGYSQLDILGQRASLRVHYREWQGHFLYQQWHATLLNSIGIEDDLINAIGKGRYYLNGIAQLQSQALWLQPPAWRFGRLNLSPAIGLADIQDIDIHNDLYEPLLFLGLPILTQRDRIDARSASLATLQTQFKWRSEHLELTTVVSQLIPFNVQSIDNSNDNEINADKKTDNYKPGRLWPGFSITAELKISF